ncbi:hypothetical protein [Ralstonia phage RP13]|nr:hypothetical protein [Ralstonia phage RP13]
MECTHSAKKTVTSTFIHPIIGDEEVETNVINEFTYEDISLHRFKCTQCNKVFYYSEAARKYYEEGIKSNILGLDGKGEL